MSLYGQYQTDPDLEKTGIWLDYGVNSKGLPTRIRIARAGGSNTTFTKLLDLKTKPYRRQIQNDTLDPNTSRRIMTEVYADGVILDWENVEDPDKNNLAFTRQNVLKVLQDLPDLFADIVDAATKVALFRQEINEADAGN